MYFSARDFIDPPKLKGKKKMNKQSSNKAMADALLDNFNTILAADGISSYRCKVPKDLELEVDDKVIIPFDNGNAFKIATVTEVHGRVKNPDENDLRWIVQKVDTTAYDAYQAQDEKAMETLMELEKRKTKRDLVNELTGGLSAEETLQLSADLGVDVCESPDPE